MSFEIETKYYGSYYNSYFSLFLKDEYFLQIVYSTINNNFISSINSTIFVIQIQILSVF